MIRFWRFIFSVIALALIAAVGIACTAPFYFRFAQGRGCESCHEMTAYVSASHGSAHRNINCMQCHTANLATKLRHLRVHVEGHTPEAISLRDVDVFEMTANCQKCHQHEYATWHAGPHSANYTQIFADSAHNSQRRLMDDCLRCHGMHFNGAVRDVVQPQNTLGPWHIKRLNIADQPTIPCMACHQLHREGAPSSKPATRLSASIAPASSSLAFYDRREQSHFAVSLLPLPQLADGSRVVKISPDQRQALCYECHAPRMPEANSVAAAKHYGPQIGSGDDRTPIGVHEGISCLACHAGHNENAATSCKTCHPQMSHCGIDVEKMDTTFSSATSTHNIHWVRCNDCHQNGVPTPKTVIRRAPNSTVPASSGAE